MEIINVRGMAEYTEWAIDYFNSIWGRGVDRKVYVDSITHCSETDSPLPNWYLMLDGDNIIGCAGLITNDFISCMDLWPWICGLFIHKDFRGKELGSLLLERGKEDARSLGFKNVYLATDHIGYYEKYGFEFIRTGYHPWDESSRVYGCKL